MSTSNIYFRGEVKKYSQCYLLNRHHIFAKLYTSYRCFDVIWYQSYTLRILFSCKKRKVVTIDFLY